jgi:DNA-binding CsgD family transcriptional regulator
MALAAAGLTVANALGDEELARLSAPREAIESALASQINSTVGRIAGPYARRRYLSGDRAEVARVLHHAMRVIAGAFGATETLLAAVELGDDATQRSARRFLVRLDEMSAIPLYAATAAEMRASDAGRRGDPAAAVYARDATLLYRHLGWPMHEARAGELGGAAALVQSDSHAGIASVLSAREREIAALVAQGIPNRRLAERLSVSQRTVEKHITSIFAKLGLRNRTELTALLLRRYT